MKVCIHNICCDISRCYTDSIILNEDIKTSEIEGADIICFVTCGYTKDKMKSCIGELFEILNKKKKTAKLGVFGCATNYDEFYNALKTVSEIDYIGRGTGKKMNEEITKYVSNKTSSKDILIPPVSFGFATPKRLNIVIQDGCNNRCAFCKSNYLNLKLNSMPFDEIIETIELFSSEYNVTEINITGLNTTQYGMDLYKAKRLAELLKTIGKMSNIETILLDTICIQDMDNELLNQILNNPKIKRVMIPVQTADNRLLSLMGRKNTKEDADKMFELISKQRPDIFLETIFLICYPTETFDNVKKNIEFLNNYNISNPVLSVYEYGYNVSSLKSENIEAMTEEMHYDLLSYYYENLIPIIEKQRRLLLEKDVEGTLVYRDSLSDYYSTLYRFTTNEYMVETKKDDNNILFNKKMLSVDFVPSIENVVYQTSPDYGTGRVLKIGK